MSQSILQPQFPRPHVRWLIRRDLPEVLAIEEECFPEFPWGEEEFMGCLGQRNCIGLVAEYHDVETGWERVVGFVIYELHKTRLHVLNLAVAADQRRRGVGRALIDKLQGKLNPQRRTRILLEVRETNTAAQLFFRAAGFRAVNVLRDYYRDSDEDAYVMQYDVRQRVSVVGREKFNTPDEFERRCER